MSAAVCDIAEVRVQQEEQKQGELFASNLVSSAFGDELFGVDIYPSVGLEAILKSVDKITFFSGDVEDHRSRVFRQADPDQLIKAGKNQRFIFSFLASQLRLTFDGDYIYDLYIDSNLLAAMQETIEKLLTIENEQKLSIDKVQQAKFEISMLKYSMKAKNINFEK